MANKNNNATATAVALQLAYETALFEFNELPAESTDEVKGEAQKKIDEAKVALDAEIEKAGSTQKLKEKLVKGKFIISPTGAYNMGYNAGESASLPELQASELEEAGYFKPNK